MVVSAPKRIVVVVIQRLFNWQNTQELIIRQSGYDAGSIAHEDTVVVL